MPVGYPVPGGGRDSSASPERTRGDVRTARARAYVCRHFTSRKNSRNINHPTYPKSIPRDCMRAGRACHRLFTSVSFRLLSPPATKNKGIIPRSRGVRGPRDRRCKIENKNCASNDTCLFSAKGIVFIHHLILNILYSFCN